MPSMLCPHSHPPGGRGTGEKEAALFIRRQPWTEGCSLNAVGGWGRGACLPGFALHPTPQPGQLSRQIPAAISLPAPCSSVLETPCSPRVDKFFSSQVESAASPSTCWVSPLRYYFKKASDEFACGAVFEEVRDDEAVLPMYEGRVLGKVERID